MAGVCNLARMTINAASGPVIPSWKVADRLRKAREEAGLGVSEFAEEIGVHRRTVSRYESGAKPPKSILLLWQMRTGVPVQWLLTGEEPGGPSGVHPPGLEPGTHWLRVQPDLDLQSAA